jgi:hypothetical protein
VDFDEMLGLLDFDSIKGVVEASSEGDKQSKNWLLNTRGIGFGEFAKLGSNTSRTIATVA